MDSEDDKIGVVEVTVDDSEDDDIPEVVEKNFESAPPQRFRGYRRGRELGRGASGQVFVCKRKGCPSGFAVKAVSLRRMRLSSNAEREQKKLRREVDILKTLPPHQNIVQLIDAFEEGDWFLLILELVGGGDLFTILTDRDPPRLLEKEAAFVLHQLADGLSFLHGQGIIHRDLKLENVLVASERRERSLVLYSVKITDFGMSKAVGAGLSDAKSRVGTRPYSAPEVWSEQFYDFSSDLWSLGVLLYVLLAGHFPFSNLPTAQAELSRVLERLKVSKAATAVVQGLLQLDPRRRLKLEAICSHEWLHAEGIADRSTKRPRTDSAERAAEEAVAAPQPTRKAGGQPGVPVVDPGGSPVLSAAAEPNRSLAQAARGPGEAPASRPWRGVADTGKSASGPARSLVDWPADASEGPSGNAPTFYAGPATEAPTASAVSTREANTEGETALARVGPGATLVYPAQGGRPAAPDTPTMGGSALAQDAQLHGPSLKSKARATEAAASGAAAASPLRLSEVRPASSQPGVMQVHMSLPEHFVSVVLGKNEAQLEQVASTAGCQVFVTSREGSSDRRLVMVGNYNQCALVQQYVLRTEGQPAPLDAELEVILLVRAEAAGVVIGKQGFVLKQIRKQSGAKVQVLREELARQRPCIITGTLESILQAEKHVFDLVRAVPMWKDWGGPNLPRKRISPALLTGKIVSWKGKVGWIQPQEAINHPKAAAHHGHIYLHEKDVKDGRSMSPGQQVSFHVYADSTGLGAEGCFAH